MNKKLFLIPLGIGLLVLIILEIIKKDPTGDNFQMTIPELANDAAVKEIDAVTVYLDNSGSIKGYVDYAGKKGKAEIIGTLSNMMDNVRNTYGVETMCLCGDNSYNRAEFLKGMEDHSIFKGAVTELHNMIQAVCDSTNKEQVSILATDMVMSYGKKELINKNDTFLNHNHLADLGAAVHQAVDKCREKELQMMLLQYYSDFNGLYYYNYTENLVENKYANQIMKDRPFYLLVIGSEKNLKSLMANNCFNTPKHVYATFEMNEKAVKSQEFAIEVDKNSKVLWQVGNPNQKEKDGSISSNTDFGNDRSTLYLTCNAFETPNYINKTDDGRFTPVFDTNVIESVEEQSVQGTGEFMLKVNLKPYGQLPKSTTTWVRLQSDNSWTASASTDDDVKEENLEGKTWGFSTVVENIHKAFHNGNTSIEPQSMAEITFNVIKL